MSFIIMSQKVNSMRNYSSCRYSARLCSHPAPTVCGGLFWTPWAVMMMAVIPAGACCAKQRQDEHKRDKTVSEHLEVRKPGDKRAGDCLD